MSGICGILHFDKKPVGTSEIKYFVNSIKHKGTDRTGVWSKNNIAFGHKMLWTTPESLHENQPLYSSEHSISLTSDARIDNRKELISQLGLNHGKCILTDGDLIIEAYKKWGIKSPKYLIGEFAFALWDEKEQLLFCVRDRIGLRPFQYFMNHKSIFFSSEISSIFQVTSLRKEIDTLSLEDYILSLSIDYEATFFMDIKRLPPASAMIVKNGKKQIIRYWTPDDIPDFNTRNIRQNSEEFFDLLRQATEAQMRSAYATGVSLSGGLDSSTVTYFASKVPSTVPFSAYSMRFGKLRCDESSYIDEVVRFTNTTSFSIDAEKMDYSYKYSINNYYNFAPDWPAFGFYLTTIPFMEMLREHDVRVLLTGHGGDHVNQGSKYYINDWIKEGKFISAMRTIMQYDNPWSSFVRPEIVKPLIPNKVLELRRSLMKLESSSILRSGRKEVSFKDIDDLYMIKNSSRRFDVKMLMGSMTSLLNDSGAYANAGYYNLEVRNPFFDHRVVQFAFQIPSWQKYSPGQQKLFFADYAQDILPDYVRRRNNKASYADMLKMQFEQNTINIDLEYYLMNNLNVMDTKGIYDIVINNNITSKWKYLTIGSWIEKNI